MFLDVFWNRLPFVARLLAIASFALLVAAAAMLFVSAREEASGARADLEVELAQELEALPAALAELAVTGDFASLQQALDRYALRPRVASVRFIDVSGKALQSADKPLPAVAPGWFFREFGFGDVAGQATIKVGGRGYGAIAIALTAQGIANRAWLRLLDHLAILLLAIVLDFLGIWLALRAGLAPLKRLEEGADAIAGGALDTRLAIEGSPELRHLIASFNRMAAASRAAQEQLRQANADLTRFAEVSAHHLMEPTRRFTSYTQRLRTRLAALPEPSKDAEVCESLGYLERDAARLRGLVRDIQLYLAAGEPRAEVRAEDVNAALAEVRQRLAPRMTATGAVLAAEPLPAAVLDRPRLMDLFELLLDNALSHGRPVDPAVPPQIRVSGERDGTLSRYRVGDNGPGIPEKYRERIFEIFERLSGGEGGTGIGLSIARRIVESRGGKIWIENLPQGGAVVAFELPDGE
ncbi:MAG: ATP-binding protein [Sulfuricella sp.]|nr:ATP-binding protein [Sulfuricella sp.]